MKIWEKQTLTLKCVVSKSDYILERHTGVICWRLLGCCLMFVFIKVGGWGRSVTLPTRSSTWQNYQAVWNVALWRKVLYLAFWWYIWADAQTKSTPISQIKSAFVCVWLGLYWHVPISLLVWLGTLSPLLRVHKYFTTSWIDKPKKGHGLEASESGKGC